MFTVILNVFPLIFAKFITVRFLTVYLYYDLSKYHIRRKRATQKYECEDLLKELAWFNIVVYKIKKKIIKTHIVLKPIIVRFRYTQNLKIKRSYSTYKKNIAVFAMPRVHEVNYLIYYLQKTKKNIYLSHLFISIVLWCYSYYL